MRLRCPALVTVVFREILVLARGRAEMHRIHFAGALFVPFTEQSNGVLHDLLRSSAFETQLPTFGITLPLAAISADVFHRVLSHPVWSVGNGKVSDRGSFLGIALELAW